VDRYRFDADPYPGLDPTTVSNCRADPDPDPTPSFKMLDKSEFFFTFLHNNASLHRFIFGHCHRVCHHIQCFGQNSLSLRLVEMNADPDPDPAK
jgi:hypothetical protein